MNPEELDTPALVLDLDALERNLERMAVACAEGGVALRPHTKNHKSPWIAAQQVAGGAVGVCAAKVGEAEVLVEGGIEDVLITTEVVPRKLERVLRLAERARIAVVVDDAAVARELGRGARARGLELAALVDVNVGQGRTGVEPEEAAALALACAEAPGLRFAGLQGYEGYLQHVDDAAERRRGAFEAYDRLAAVRDEIAAAGLEVPWVSTAGTGTHRFAIEHGLATEVQPGSYTVMDCDYGEVEGLPFEQALYVLAGVVSVNRPGAVIVDAGFKTISTDAGMPVVRGEPGATYAPAGDEHGRVTGLPAGLRPGDPVWLVPSHCDTTINLHDRYVLVRGGEVAGELSIAGRGRVT